FQEMIDSQVEITLCSRDGRSAEHKLPLAYGADLELAVTSSSLYRVDEHEEDGAFGWTGQVTVLVFLFEDIMHFTIKPFGLLDWMAWHASGKQQTKIYSAEIFSWVLMHMQEVPEDVRSHLPDGGDIFVS
ncbi:hypothetical protein ACJX0J_019330, partial [Zea mays]